MYVTYLLCAHLECKDNHDRERHPIRVVLCRRRHRWMLVHVSFDKHPGISLRTMYDMYLRGGDRASGCCCLTIADDLIRGYVDQYSLENMEIRGGEYPPELVVWLGESTARHIERRDKSYKQRRMNAAKPTP